MDLELVDGGANPTEAIDWSKVTSALQNLARNAPQILVTIANHLALVKGPASMAESEDPNCPDCPDCFKK